MTLLEPRVSALPGWARAVAAGLRALSLMSFPLLLVALVRAADPPIDPATLAQALAALALAPELCARLVLRAFAADVRATGATLAIAGALRGFEVPLASVARAHVWRMPLPRSGLSLALRSGARLPVALAARDPVPLLAALAGAGIAVPSPDDDAALSYARASAERSPRVWQRPLVAIGLASLAPAAVGFYAHQHIAFGGLLGEYYLMGARAWLTTALRYEITSALYLVLWWGCFSIAIELACYVGALAAPALAQSARRIAERTGALLYFASIPTLLALRFLA